MRGRLGEGEAFLGGEVGGRLIARVMRRKSVIFIYGYTRSRAGTFMLCYLNNGREACRITFHKRALV